MTSERKRGRPSGRLSLTLEGKSPALRRAEATSAAQADGVVAAGSSAPAPRTAARTPSGASRHIPLKDHAGRELGPHRAETDMWMYSADGPRLFRPGEEIPAGYEDSPAKL